MHAPIKGQVKNIMPPTAHMMGAEGKKGSYNHKTTEFWNNHTNNTHTPI